MGKVSSQDATPSHSTSSQHYGEAEYESERRDVSICEGGSWERHQEQESNSTGSLFREVSCVVSWYSNLRGIYKGTEGIEGREWKRGDGREGKDIMREREGKKK